MASVFIRTILIYVILNIMLKIMGKRQIGELEVSELVCTLLISEIASIPISDPNIPFLYALLPILFICSLEILISVIKNRSNTVKKIIEGKSTYIIYKGKLRQGTLKENRISINEVLTEMRTQNISDISDVYYAILEQNGKISLFSTEDKLAHPLIIDGKEDFDNINELHLDINAIEKKLKKQNLKKEDIFLLTITDNGEFNIIKKEEKD